MSKKKTQDNTLHIKELDTIVAIEILKSTYNLDVYNFSKEKISEIISLLQTAKGNRDIEKEKNNDTS